ncbi:hypothetical protein HK102_002858, partial [Quaeritorhiza haematococci]
MSLHALVYGGSGALGRAIVAKFRSANWVVLSVDFRENPEANHNIILDQGLSFEETGSKVSTEITNRLEARKLDAILNVAGGWAGGNLASE